MFVLRQVDSGTHHMMPPPVDFLHFGAVTEMRQKCCCTGSERFQGRFPERALLSVGRVPIKLFLRRYTMKCLFLKLSSIALLLAGSNLGAVNAQEVETKGAVPTRADANNPDSDVYRASDVMNLPVKDDAGMEIGRIKDLVINGETREVLYAVVSMQGAKESDSLYVMPWTVFQPTYGQRNAIQFAVLGLPQNIWMQAPYYSPAQWRQSSFSQWGPQVNNYYVNHIPAGGAGGVEGVNGKSNSVRANKPVVSKDGADKPNKDTPAPKAKPNDAAPKADKPGAANDAAKTTPPAKPKSNVDPKGAEKAPEKVPSKEADAPAAKVPAVTAPKEAPPAAPKIPSAATDPAPKELKPASPSPK
jgi:sporulation protein YlmC with PRC-barrel domain